MRDQGDGRFHDALVALVAVDPGYVEGPQWIPSHAGGEFSETIKIVSENLQGRRFVLYQKHISLRMRMGQLDKAPRWQVGAAQALRLGQALRAARQALGITVTAAAQAAQISRVTWHRLERGESAVALGALTAAARVLDMALALVPTDAAGNVTSSAPDDCLPLQILLADYPQLRQLAWQVGDGRHVLTPREALGLYERNWRHVQHAALDLRERALLDALRRVFGAEFLGV